MKKKTADINREAAAKTVAALGRVRGMSDEPTVKRRLREAEERLSVAPPVTQTDCSALDAELFALTEKLPEVLKEGVLKERYLDRIDELIARRRTMK